MKRYTTYSAFVGYLFTANCLIMRGLGPIKLGLHTVGKTYLLTYSMEQSPS
jgi:hypothetical protein